jgi:tRNA (guanine37-N1)-methyltransferase
MSLRFGVISLFPEMFEAIRRYGISGRAIDKGLARLEIFNPRDYTTDVHRTVDDRPYGGGPGMVMLAAPVQAAISAARQALGAEAKTLYLSPQGRRLDQAAVRELAGRETMILVAGRYEGIDERLIEAAIDEEWSLGDFVLSGGELAAMALMDACIRLKPGALGHADSAQEDSFFDGLLDCPHYTRPEQVLGRAVPEVLLSGDHAAIRRWRLKQSLGRTWRRRPDLLAGRVLSVEEQRLLREYQQEFAASGEAVESAAPSG